MQILVFAPGIMGSVLQSDVGRVWPPTTLEAIVGYKRINELMGDDLRATDLILRVGPLGFYDSLVDDIRACGYATGSDEKKFIPFPYDWRRSNVETAQRLADTLDRELATIAANVSITFLGHSMGGLVMRYVLESGTFSDRSWFPSVERLITLGTPQRGAPIALYRLTGRDKVVGLSGRDVRRLANDSRFSSTYELVAPNTTALTLKRPLRGFSPSAMDPFDPAIEESLRLSSQNIAKARRFWSGLGLDRRPDGIDYLFVVGSEMKTQVRNEWSGTPHDPEPIERKSSGDGTVPIASAISPEIPHIFSRKKHQTIFADRAVREYLYIVLGADPDVRPQAAEDTVVGAEEAVGLSVNQDVYDPGEEIEVVVSFNKDMDNPRESFELVRLDPETEDADPETDPRDISLALTGVSVSVFKFSITEILEPGLYQLRSLREVDDPAPTVFYVRKVPDDAS